MKILLPVILSLTFLAAALIIKVSHFGKAQPIPEKTQTLGVQSIDSVKAKESPSPSPNPSQQTRPATSANYSGFCLNVPILMYHHIQPETLAKQKGQTSLTVDAGTFENQMKYLAGRGYQTISADQLAQALINHQKLGRSIVLTFDDGYADFYTYAYPIITKYHLIANLMIATGLLQNPDYLTWQQLKDLNSSGIVFAYDHTWSHRNLGSASTDIISREVLTAKSQLQANLGKPVDIFAYPYGSENQTVINFLKTNGFIAALSTFSGQVQCDSFLMTLHRTRIGNSALSAYGI